MDEAWTIPVQTLNPSRRAASNPTPIERNPIPFLTLPYRLSDSGRLPKEITPPC